jgi:hypothetical protein
VPGLGKIFVEYSNSDESKVAKKVNFIKIGFNWKNF